MTLSPAQLAARDGKITASFVPKLMAGKTSEILNEWRRLVGDDGYEPPDLSDKWPVQLGHHMEPFALDWHERKCGPLTRRGEVVVHPGLPHVCCTLDAYRASDNTVIDVKSVGGWRKLGDVCPYYLPQMIVQRACTGATGAALLVVHGGAEPAEYALTITDEYEAQVWDQIAWFWQCVLDLRPPVEVEPIAPPVVAAVEYDMKDSNSWADRAGAWLEHRAAAKTFQAAEKDLKALVPADAKRCYGHGITINRSKAGALSIKGET